VLATVIYKRYILPSMNVITIGTLRGQGSKVGSGKEINISKTLNYYGFVRRFSRPDSGLCSGDEGEQVPPHQTSLWDPHD
jgi:hypothetical protein